MKNTVFLKRIAILAFFTLFGGIWHVHSMESTAPKAASTEAVVSFHTLLQSNLTTALHAIETKHNAPNTHQAERKKLAASTQVVQAALEKWNSLPDLTAPVSFEAIFSHMNKVYDKFVTTKKIPAQGQLQQVQANVAFVEFIYPEWTTVVRACDFIISTEKLSHEKIFFLFSIFNAFGTTPITPTLAHYNAPGNETLFISSLDGEMLVLLAQCYEYFLTAVSRTPAVFGITALRELQAAFTQAKQLAPEAPEADKQKRQLALSDLFTMVINLCLNKGMFSVYEDNSISVNIDAAAQALGYTGTPKKLRKAKRTMVDPSHRIFETIVAFIPLLLMSSMNALMVQYCGDNGAFTLMVLNISTMIAAMFTGNSKLVQFLSFINPMRLAPLMWLIRSAGHRAIDCVVAKSGSKGIMWPASWLATKGQQLYQTYMISKFLYPIIVAILTPIISAGTSIAGGTYDMARDMLFALPTILLGRGPVPA